MPSPCYMSKTRKQPLESCTFSWPSATCGNFFLKIKLATIITKGDGLILLCEVLAGSTQQQAGWTLSQMPHVGGQAGSDSSEGFLFGLPLVNLICHQPSPRGGDWIASGTSETSTSGVGLWVRPREQLAPDFTPHPPEWQEAEKQG